MAEAGAGEKEELKPEHYEDFFDCARYGELEGVGIYIDHGADVNWTDDFGNTALHRAAANGHVDVVQSLITAGATLQANEQGNTPLHWASQQHQTEVVRLLLEACDDADVMAVNAAGQSSLDMAEDAGWADTAALLVTHKSVDAEAEKLTAVGQGAAPATQPPSTAAAADAAE